MKLMFKDAGNHSYFWSVLGGVFAWLADYQNLILVSLVYQDRLAIIGSAEGLSLDPYQCLADVYVLTVGIGSTDTADDADKKESEKHKAQMEAQFIDGLRELSQQLDGEGLIKLTEMLLKPDFVAFQRDDHNNGDDTKLTKLNMDAAFEDMGEVVELLIFVLKLNFAPFFTKYLSRLGLGQKRKTA